MIPYPEINPEIVRIGPLSIRWYGIMYILGFASSYFLVRYQLKKKGQEAPLPFEQAGNLYSYLMLGLLIGARIGYVIFYNLSHYIKHPLEIFAVWQGGMSFHGGLIGSIAAGILFCKKFRLDFWMVSDLIIPTAPIGLGLGRLANFINGELYGRVTNMPWAMVFPHGGHLPRHPSQLYEFLLEGVMLFSILWILKDKGFRAGTLSSVFLILYGIFRFFIEFFREPDPQLGFIFSALTTGQILSAGMLLIGIGILFYKKTTI